MVSAALVGCGSEAAPAQSDAPAAAPEQKAEETMAAGIAAVNAAKTAIENKEAAEAAIAAAKADPANKDLVEAALVAIDKLTDEQKAEETRNRILDLVKAL